jgi:hypothetical protein
LARLLFAARPRVPSRTLTHYRAPINWSGDCQFRLPEDRAVVAAAA